MQYAEHEIKTEKLRNSNVYAYMSIYIENITNHLTKRQCKQEIYLFSLIFQW